MMNSRQISDIRYQISEYKLPMTNDKFPIPNSRFPITLYFYVFFCDFAASWLILILDGLPPNKPAD